jgi:hypothetical protein
MVSEVRLDPLAPQEALDLRELLDLLDLREPRDPLVLRDLQGLPEPLQRLLPLHQHRLQTLKVIAHQELQILFHLARSGTQLPMLAFVPVMQLNSPLSHHVLSYQELNTVPVPETQRS